MGIEAILGNPYVWLVVAAVAAVAEVLSVSLITVWFVVGGIVAFFVGFFGGPAWVQLVVFLIVSIASLVLLRPVVLKYRKQGESHEVTLVGTQATVVEAIGAGDLSGRVETPDRVTWTALSASGQPIEVGALVKVVDQKSIKLIVERI